MLTTDFWKKYFKEYDLLNELTPYNELLDAVCHYSNIQSGNRALDVGSGTGNLSIKLEKIGAKVTSIDFSKEGIEIHKSKGSKADIIYGDISERLPFSDNYFDSVVSNNVLYTIAKEKRPEVLRELHRVLKPGGRIVISNIVEDFRPHFIYLDHLKRLAVERGTLKAFFRVVTLLWPTIKILYYNHLINREHEFGSYDFFQEKEQGRLLASTGFDHISDDLILYSGQAVLNWGIK